MDHVYLQNVVVDLGLIDGDNAQIALLKPALLIPCARLDHSVPGSVFLVYERIQNVTPTATFSASLKFMMHEDGDERGYEDLYVVEDVVLCIGDYLLPCASSPQQFESAWTDANNCTVVETYSLSVPTISECVKQLGTLLGTSPSGKVNEAAHAFSFTSMLVGGTRVFCKCRMVLNQQGVDLEISAASPDERLAHSVCDAID